MDKSNIHEILELLSCFLLICRLGHINYYCLIIIARSGNNNFYAPVDILVGSSLIVLLP